MYVLASKFYYLEFRLLLSRVAPYYSSLPRTVWKKIIRYFGASDIITPLRKLGSKLEKDHIFSLDPFHLLVRLFSR